MCRAELHRQSGRLLVDALQKLRVVSSARIARGTCADPLVARRFVTLRSAAVIEVAGDDQVADP
jgi:hypothetical protein